MNGNDPLIADDAKTDEERLEEEQRLLSLGIKPSELSAEEKEQLDDDLNDDERGAQLSDGGHDDGGDPASLVPKDEQDGND